MTKSLFTFVVFIAFLVGLIAPFSFLPPKKQNIDDPEPAVTTTKSKSKKKAPDVVLLPEEIEDPLHDYTLPNFAAIKNVNKKKKAFFDYLRPVVRQQNAKIKVLRTRLLAMQTQSLEQQSLSHRQVEQLKLLAKYYRVKDSLPVDEMIEKLLIRVDTIPEQLVLVQAANESAWGTSRFARIGLNFFGMWCYTPNCGMVPNGREDGDVHEVEKFDSIEHAVRRYFKYLNSSRNYTEMRQIRAQLRANNQPVKAAELVNGLLSYSERGQEYVDEIQTMLRHNKQFFQPARISAD